MSTEAINTILVFEENGRACHRFCTEAEARGALEGVSQSGGSATALVTTSPDVALSYECMSGLRKRVEAAKVALQRDICFHTALDANGVPDEPGLRRSVFAAFEQLQAA